MADCPTGRYLTEIVTAGGLTLDHPTEDTTTTLGVPHSIVDWSGSEWDYAEWDALALISRGRLEKAWKDLKEWPGIEKMPAAEYNALAEALTIVRQRYFDLRSPWTNNSDKIGGIGWTWGFDNPTITWDAAPEIGVMTGLIVDMQCLRQRIDETLGAYGGAPDTPGDTGHKPPVPGASLAMWGFGIVAAFGVGFGVFHLATSRKGRR